MARKGGNLRGWPIGFCLAALLGGCQAPAARFPDADHPPCPSRGAVLAGQLVADTAVAVTCHPARSAWAVMSEPVEFLGSAGHDVFGKRLALALAHRPEPLSPKRDCLDRAELQADMECVCGKEAQLAHLQLYTDGAEALAALECLIDSACERIDVLMFLWDNDGLGRHVAARLAAKACPQVRVRVLVDGCGNLIHGLPCGASTEEVNRVVCWLAQQPNVEVIRTRNPLCRADHRKLVLVDGKAAWTGGRNFTEPAFFTQRDLSFTLTGPLAGEMAAEFERFWKEQGGKPEEQGDSCKANDLEPAGLPANARGHLVGTGPMRRHFAHTLYDAVDRAKHHVYVENPYFTDGWLLYKLVRARQRGADVRVVLPKSSLCDLIDRANRVTANRLLEAGVRVYFHPCPTHVKATSVDTCWAYLGTGNFDPLSLRYNREMGMAVCGGPIIAEMEERLFLPDFCPSWELKEPLPVTPCDYACEVLASLVL